MNADDEGQGTLRRSQSVVPRAAPTGSAARNKRQDEFNQIFELTHEELLEDYSCAYQSDKLLYHGRMYVSRNYVCFHSQIFKKTIKILEFRNIQDVQKKNTAIVFPNALELTVKNRKFLFASFLYRDQAYKLVSELWEESKRNRVFKSLAVKEARKKHDEELAREASFEVASESSAEEESEEESEETDSSDGEPFEEVLPSALPRSAPTPTPLAPASSSIPADCMSLAPPDDGASSAKSVSPPFSSTSSSTQPSPPSNSTKLRNLSVNISQNVNGWVHSVGWPMNKLRADDGTNEALDAPPKKDIELREFSSDGESSRTVEEDQVTRLSLLDEHHETGLKDSEHSTPPNNSTLNATEVGAVSPDAEPSKDDGGDRESSQKSESAQSKEKEESSGGGGDGDEKAERSGSRRKRREDKEKTDEATKAPEPPAVVQTAVPVLEACSHISAGWSSGQAMVNVLLPIAVGDMFYTFFDDKNSDVPVFWNELHTQEPLSYTEVSMGQWTPQTDNCCLRRSVGFRVALKHPLGPKSTRVQQEQRIHYMNKDTLVMETTSVSLDVPYGDTFTTDTRWVMSAATANGKPATRVTVTVDIKFTKSVWIKGVIQSNAVDGVSTYFPAWAEKAQRLLARKSRAAAAAASAAASAPAPASASPKRTSRKGGSSSTRSSKRQAAAPGSETPSKLRKSRRRALLDEKEDRPDALASAVGVTMEDEGTGAPPTFMDTSFNSLPSTPREEESLVASLIHMVFPNLPVPPLPFSLSAVAGVALLITLAYFLLPALLSLPSLSGRVASLESDIYKLRRLNTHLKDRVLFMQLALSSLTSSADGDPAETASNQHRDALPELWRYWKLHRHLRERVDALVLQLRKTHDLLGHLRDDVATVVAPSSPDTLSASPPSPPADDDYVTDAFLHTVARALDAAADDDTALLDKWSLDEDARDGGSFWSWVWFLFKLTFVWLPLITVVAAMLANTLGLFPPLLPFPLPLENALRPYASFLLPLPEPFIKPHQA